MPKKKKIAEIVLYDNSTYTYESSRGPDCDTKPPETRATKKTKKRKKASR